MTGILSQSFLDAAKAANMRPEFYAIKTNNVKVLKALIGSGTIDLTACDNFMINYAARLGYVEIFRLIVDNGGMVQSSGRLLGNAVESENMEILTLVLENSEFLKTESYRLQQYLCWRKFRNMDVFLFLFSYAKETLTESDLNCLIGSLNRFDYDNKKLVLKLLREEGATGYYSDSEDEECPSHPNIDPIRRNRICHLDHNNAWLVLPRTKPHEYYGRAYHCDNCQSWGCRDGLTDDIIGEKVDSIDFRCVYCYSNHP